MRLWISLTPFWLHRVRGKNVRQCGRVRVFEAKYAFSKELTSMLQEGLKGATTESDFPISQKELDKDFHGEGVRIVDSYFDVVEGKLTGEYRIEFENAALFFQVPGMRNRFLFYAEGDQLILKSIPKGGIPQNASQNPLPLQTDSAGDADFSGQMEDFQEGMKAMEGALQESMKAFFHGLKISVLVELPNEILDSNATHVKGHKASWIVDENTIFESSAGKPLDDHLWVSCSLKGLSFRPTMEQAAKGLTANHQQEYERVKSPPKASSPQIDVEPDNSKTSLALASQLSLPDRQKNTEPQSPETLTQGGRSLIVLKNGRRIKVDGYYKEGNMLTLRRYGGTISLPISSIDEVQTKSY
jgi:hypothetical protein